MLSPSRCLSREPGPILVLAIIAVAAAGCGDERAPGEVEGDQDAIAASESPESDPPDGFVPDDGLPDDVSSEDAEATTDASGSHASPQCRLECLAQEGNDDFPTCVQMVSLDERGEPVVSLDAPSAWGAEAVLMAPGRQPLRIRASNDSGNPVLRSFATTELGHTVLTMNVIEFGAGVIIEHQGRETPIIKPDALGSYHTLLLWLDAEYAIISSEFIPGVSDEWSWVIALPGGDIVLAIEDWIHDPSRVLLTRRSPDGQVVWTRGLAMPPLPLHDLCAVVRDDEAIEVLIRPTDVFGAACEGTRRFALSDGASVGTCP